MASGGTCSSQTALSMASTSPPGMEGQMGILELSLA
jgi:hypothetical protein